MWVLESTLVVGLVDDVAALDCAGVRGGKAASVMDCFVELLLVKSVLEGDSRP